MPRLKTSTALFLAGLLFPAASYAQSVPLFQMGQVVPNDLAKYERNGQSRNAGTIAGDNNGIGVNPFAATDYGQPGVCSNSGPTTSPYSQICIGHNAAGDPVMSIGSFAGESNHNLFFDINGTLYPFNSGLGNVSGPTVTTVGELASWNSTTGNLLRQGAPATFTGSQTIGSTLDGYQLQLKNQTSSDANALYIWTCVIYVCNNPAAVGNFDNLRIITVVPPASTTELQTSLGIYFINKTGRTGPNYPSFPVYVGQNIIGICDADGAGCWAGNSVISDNRGQGTPTPKPLRYMVGWEADLQVSSINSQVNGFMTGGSSTAQPNGATGYSCLWLDGPVAQGTVAKWTSCIGSQSGSGLVFATIGARAATGASTASQIVNMLYRDASNVLQTSSFAATPGGFLFAATGAAVAASVVIPAGAVFAAGDGGGVTIGTRAVSSATGTVLGLGGDTAWTSVNVGSVNAPLQLIAAAAGVTIPTSRPLTMAGPINLTGAAAPANPPGGWFIYTDSGDGNKLKAKASTGTTVTLGTP